MKEQKKRGWKIFLLGMGGIYGTLMFLILPIIIVASMLGSSVTTAAGGNAQIPLSPEVEAYRGLVTQYAEMYGIREYVDLLLAVMMQESGGKGNDVFQAAESMGQAPGSLPTPEVSINQGVKVIAERLKASGATGANDIEHIKLAIQGYNFGGGYITYALANGGGWTQDNTYGYAQIHSKGVKNTGKRIEQLGPWRYGDQYYTKHVLRYYGPACTGGMGTAGESAQIPLNERLNFLFPGGVPSSEGQMNQYLTTITVPINDTSGGQTTMTLRVHQKLAVDLTAVFTEIQTTGFVVKANDTAGYCWRMMASGTGLLSHHSYGCVIDLNWNDNPMMGSTASPGAYQPGKNPYSVTPEVVQIFKKYGFYWGGDWTSPVDYMHFTYTNH